MSCPIAPTVIVINTKHRLYKHLLVVSVLYFLLDVQLDTGLEIIGGI